MPGYKSLPEQFSGLAAERVRLAEVLQRVGANEDAAHMLESALEVCATANPELPGWLCGRLAAVYRALKRYDDEVRLLVRFRDSQTSDEARARFDARLSKARAIAERKSRPDTRMLASVRTAVGRRSTPVGSVSQRALGFDPGVIAALSEAFASSASSGDEVGLTAALLSLRLEAKLNGCAPEQMVLAIKGAWRGADPPANVDPEAWNALYREVLTRSLALYFDEEES